MTQGILKFILKTFIVDCFLIFTDNIKFSLEIVVFLVMIGNARCKDVGFYPP